MSETSSAEPPPLKLLALVAATLSIAFIPVACVVYILWVLPDDAPKSAPQTVSRSIITPAAAMPHTSRVKPLLTHLKRMHKPVKRRRAKR